MGLFSNNNGKKLTEKAVEATRAVEHIKEEGVMESICFISKETKIKGQIHTKSMFQLEGEMEGDIQGELLIHIGMPGKLKGNIIGTSVLIDGEVLGEIIADRVEIGPKGRVQAQITSNIFVVQEGGIFEGNKKIKEPTKLAEREKKIESKKVDETKTKEKK